MIRSRLITWEQQSFPNSVSTLQSSYDPLSACLSTWLPVHLYTCLPDCPFLFLPVSPQRLKHTESDRLQVQIQAYLDNVFDVGTLLEDAETKTAALERVEELEESLGTVRETDGVADRFRTILTVFVLRCLGVHWTWKTKQSQIDRDRQVKQQTDRCCTDPSISLSLSTDVRAPAGCRERSNAEDRWAGETADANQQRPGPRSGQCCYHGNHTNT